MKKTIILTLCILCAGNIFADSKSNAILEKFSAKMRSLKSYSIDASLKNQGETQKVQIIVADNKFIVCSKDYDIYADGKSKWSHMKLDNEVILENQDNSDNATITDNPKKMFENLAKSAPFHNYQGQENVDGKSCDIVKLKESAKASTYILLYIDKATQRPVKLSVMNNRDISDFDINIERFTENVDVKSTIFSFDKTKFPKVQLVDLR